MGNNERKMSFGDMYQFAVLDKDRQGFKSMVEEELEQERHAEELSKRRQLEPEAEFQEVTIVEL